ncbi:Hypothetical protein HVR_LOCUS752 [uncultured virus]|nr:Hypothetical protein HVR_LOCUS752 [uncultured virus]
MAAHKILITGTGRSGTTFLISLLTYLGINTGYSKDSYKNYINANVNAGMEKPPHPSYVIKDPNFCTMMPDMTKRYQIDHVFVLVRNMDDAANSRISIGRGLGGLWDTLDPNKQKSVLLEKFGTLISDLVLHNIPYTCMIFPRLALDPEYCYKCLKPLFDKITTPISYAVFLEAFKANSDPRLIHEYKSK